MAIDPDELNGFILDHLAEDIYDGAGFDPDEGRHDRPFSLLLEDYVEAAGTPRHAIDTIIDKYCVNVRSLVRHLHEKYLNEKYFVDSEKHGGRPEDHWSVALMTFLAVERWRKCSRVNPFDRHRGLVKKLRYDGERTTHSVIHNRYYKKAQPLTKLRQLYAVDKQTAQHHFGGDPDTMADTIIIFGPTDCEVLPDQSIFALKCRQCLRPTIDDSGKLDLFDSIVSFWTPSGALTLRRADIARSQEGLHSGRKDRDYVISIYERDEYGDECQTLVDFDADSYTFATRATTTLESDTYIGTPRLGPTTKLL